MRFSEPPSLDSPARGRPGEDLDGLLRNFFRSEMPEPWPEMKSPQEATAEPTLLMPQRKTHSFLRSRLALAASIALLLAGGWLLSDSFKDGNGGTSIKPPTGVEAAVPHIRDWHLRQQPGGPTEIRIIMDQVTPPKPKKDNARDQLSDQLP